MFFRMMGTFAPVLDRHPLLGVVAGAGGASVVVRPPRRKFTQDAGHRELHELRLGRNALVRGCRRRNRAVSAHRKELDQVDESRVAPLAMLTITTLSPRAIEIVAQG